MFIDALQVWCGIIDLTKSHFDNALQYNSTLTFQEP